MTDTLQAESDIRRLIANYADIIFRKDWDGLRTCWDADGVWHAFGRRTEGREAIVAWVSGLSAMFRLIWQTYHNIVIDVSGDQANARLYVDEITCDEGGTRRFAMGIYHDRYRRTAQGWVFAERHWNLLYLGPPDLSARFWDMPAFGPSPHDPDMQRRPNRPTLEELQKELGL